MHPLSSILYLSSLAALLLLIDPVSLFLGSYSFVRTYSPYSNNYDPLSIELPSGDLVVVAKANFITPQETQITKITVYCLDNRGVVKWNKHYGTFLDKNHYDLVQSNQGNIAIISSVQVSTQSDGIHLFVLDQHNGTILISKAYHFEGILTQVAHLTATPDGGFIIDGQCIVGESEFKKIFLFKVDSSGDFVWGIRNTDIDKEIFNARSFVTPDGDIVLGGFANKLTASPNDVFLLKVSDAGVVKWFKMYGFTDISLSPRWFAQGDDGYVWCWTYQKNGIQYLDIAKVSLDGVLLYSKMIQVQSFSEYVRDISIDSQNNVLILSFVIIQQDNTQNARLIKLSPSLDFVSQYQYKVQMNDNPTRVLILSDGGYLVSGSRRYESDYSYFLYLVKLENDYKVCGHLDSVINNHTSATIDTGVTQTNTSGPSQYSFESFTLDVFVSYLVENSFSFTSSRQNQEQCDIYDASYTPPVTSNQIDNECGCSENGTCDTDASTCTCAAGYVGQKCQYLESEIDELINTTTAAISSVIENYQSMEPVDALTQASYLSAAPDLITSDSFSSLSSMVQALAAPRSGPVSQEIMQSAMEVQSNLSQLKPTTEAEQLEVAKKISSSTSRIIEANLDSNLVIQTKQISIRVEDIDPSEAATVTPSEQAAAEIPPGVSQCGGTSKLAAVTYGALSYSGLSTANEVKESSVFSADLYCDGAKQTVKGLETPIKLEFLANSVRGKEVLSQIKEGVITEQQALSAGFFECRFYDEETNTLSSEGCEVVRLTETSFICECTHLTNFLSFFNKGAEVLQDSNYDVWLALPLITLESLKTNIGFYIACTYWVFYFFLAILLAITDRKIIKKNRLKLLFKMSHTPLQTEDCIDQTMDSDASVYPVETFQGKNVNNRTKSREGKINKIDNKSKFGKTEFQHRQNSIVIDQVIDPKQRRSSNIRRISTQDRKLPPLFTLAKQKSKNPGSCVRAKQKIQAQLQEKAAAYQHRCCCCVCCGMAKREISDKNMLVGLCCKTSPLYSRCVRLSVLLLGVLTDITMCGLFFNLEPIEETFQFWDSLVENVWVGLFSALLSLPFIIILVLSFRIPSSVLRSFQETTSLKQLESVYRSHSKRLQCHRCLGFTFFFLLSNFLCLYLVAFGHVISMNLQKNWVQSSGASLVIDLVAFEVLPALFFGAVGLLIFTCDCKCCLCALVSLDLYRVFRNIAA